MTVRLRGISAVDANIAWASGREGTVLRTLDGGKTWTNVSVPDAKALDFRDIEGFDANTAVVLSIGPGDASRVYRTDRRRQVVDARAEERRRTRVLRLHGVRWSDTAGCSAIPSTARYQIRETTRRRTHVDAAAERARSAEGRSGVRCERHVHRDRAVRASVLVVSGGAAARVQCAATRRTTVVPARDARWPHRIPAAGIFSIATAMGGDIAARRRRFRTRSDGQRGMPRFGADTA